MASCTNTSAIRQQEEMVVGAGAPHHPAFDGCEFDANSEHGHVVQGVHAAERRRWPPLTLMQPHEPSWQAAPTLAPSASRRRRWWCLTIFHSAAANSTRIRNTATWCEECTALRVSKDGPHPPSCSPMSPHGKLHQHQRHPPAGGDGGVKFAAAVRQVWDGEAPPSPCWRMALWLVHLAMRAHRVA